MVCKSVDADPPVPPRTCPSTQAAKGSTGDANLGVAEPVGTRVGRCLAVEVRLSSAAVEQPSSDGDMLNRSGMTVMAVFDTGAMKSVMSPACVRTLEQASGGKSLLSGEAQRIRLAGVLGKGVQEGYVARTVPIRVSVGAGTSHERSAPVTFAVVPGADTPL